MDTIFIKYHELTQIFYEQTKENSTNSTGLQSFNIRKIIAVVRK